MHSIDVWCGLTNSCCSFIFFFFSSSQQKTTGTAWIKKTMGIGCPCLVLPHRSRTRYLRIGLALVWSGMPWFQLGTHSINTMQSKLSFKCTARTVRNIGGDSRALRQRRWFGTFGTEQYQDNKYCGWGNTQERSDYTQALRRLGGIGRGNWCWWFGSIGCIQNITRCIDIIVAWIERYKICTGMC